MLCKLLKAHINVDYCSSVKAIKYIVKYVNKGSDLATFAIGDECEWYEVNFYQIWRYILSNEAIWMIFGFDIHQRYSTVVNRVVHVEDKQRVYFTEDTGHNLSQTTFETTLTTFFQTLSTECFWWDPSCT